MTYYEMWLNEYHKLPAVIKQRKRTIAEMYKRYLAAENADDKRYYKRSIEAEIALLERNRKRLDDLAETLRINNSDDAATPRDDDREASRVCLNLCDKVWNRRSNR